VGNLVKTLRLVMGAAVAAGLPDNPMLGVRVTRSAPAGRITDPDEMTALPEKVPTSEQLAVIEKDLEERYRIIVLLASRLGLFSSSSIGIAESGSTTPF
jgi:hypothetical protein